MTTETNRIIFTLRNAIDVRLLGRMALAAVMGMAGVAAAGSYTNSASGNWDADASWTGAKPSAGGASDAAIVFNAVGADASTNNLAGTFLLNRMDFAAGAVPSGNELFRHVYSFLP